MSVRRGEVYFANLDPVRGREQSGLRPVVVLSVNEINRMPLVVTVVVGTKGANVARDFDTNVRVSPAESGLPLETVFLGFQVRSIDKDRLEVRPAGCLSEETLARVEDAVRKCLGL
ncbi:MAG: type II toxin-antitoxin system PemK/MazF family toxin [Planctomycetales bacterium]|nr:type II toxin-antitoxin system PemK/MazF family toxin [Planctomycetales bacterium]